MAFGAKIKLSVDQTKTGALKKEIQSVVDSATSKNPVYIHNIKVTKEATNKLLSDLKSDLSSAKGIEIPIRKINADAAIAQLKSDLTTMLGGLKISGLKDFLGTEGVEDAYKKAASASESYMKSAEKAAQKGLNLSSTKKQINDIYKTLSSAYKDIGNLNPNSGKTDEYLNNYNTLIEKVQSLNKIDAERSQEALQRISKEAAALKQKTAAEKQASDESIKASKRQKSASDDNYSSLKKQADLSARISRYLQVNTKISSSTQGNKLRTMLRELDSGATLSITRLKEIEGEFSNIRSIAIKTGQTGKTLFDKISSAYQKFGGWSIVTKSMTAASRVIRQMYENVTQLDTAMTELKKVTDETSETYSNFLKSSANEAKNLGATVSDRVSATADFARLGYNLNDASSLADTAIIYKNVGDGIDDINSASESIISTMKAFNISATDSMNIVDKFNIIGNNFAISSKGIGDALLRSASSLKTANSTLDESIALITAANSTVQDPEKVGTAMKTISMYLRAAKTEAEDAGESTDGMAESVSELRQDILTLTKTKVDIQIDENTFKSPYQIMKELSQVWGQLEDLDKANIVEKIGGKRNSNVVTSLLENFDVAEKVLEKTGNATGSAMAENEQYLDSIAGKTSQFKASFEELSSSVLNSDFLKNLISGGTTLLDILNKIIDGLGTIPVLFTTITGALSASKNVGELINQFQFLIILRIEYAHEAFTNGDMNEIALYSFCN